MSRQVLYMHAGVPYEERWSGWALHRDPAREEDLAARAGLGDGGGGRRPRFAFVHDDPARGFVLDRRRVADAAAAAASASAAAASAAAAAAAAACAACAACACAACAACAPVSVSYLAAAAATFAAEAVTATAIGDGGSREKGDS
jgi:hypothetical protein